MTAARRRRAARGKVGSRGQARSGHRRSWSGAVARAPSVAASSPSARDRLAWLAVAMVLVVPPFLVSPTAEDAFRLPKLAASETLALLSLLLAALGWWRPGMVALGALARREATVFAALLAAGALPGALTALHPGHWLRASISLALALGCIVMWSARLGRPALRRALDLVALPALALALLAALQSHALFRPFVFARDQGERFSLTSLAGSVGDLGAYLVLPVLLLQIALVRARRIASRVAIAAALLVLVYGLVLSQTLAALLAVGVGSLVLWSLVLGRRRMWLALAAVLAVGAGALTMPGLRRRVLVKVGELRELDLDPLLSGRPDAWRTALEMFRGHPLVGVGHGGFGSSFASAKLALLEAGNKFWARIDTQHFVNAHNEYLEALAEWGLVGALALVGAVAVVVRRLRHLARAGDSADFALAVAGTTALAVLSAAAFPLRMALTAYPWLAFAAWLFAAPTAATAEGAAASEDELRAAVPARAWAASLCLVLSLALVAHGRALLGRIEASQIVRTTTEVAQLALQRREVAVVRPVLQANLAVLRRAAELDPLLVGVPLAAGSHYYLLGNGAAALESYDRGLEIEPRAALHFNRARALLLLGRTAEAGTALELAVALDPSLTGEAEALGMRKPEPERRHRHRSP